MMPVALLIGTVNPIDALNVLAGDRKRLEGVFYQLRRAEAERSRTTRRGVLSLLFTGRATRGNHGDAVFFRRWHSLPVARMLPKGSGFAF